MSAYTVVRRVTLAPHHGPTGRTRHYAGDRELPAPAALSIARYPDASGFYLLYLDNEGRELTDTYHESLDEAMAQAEWEFRVRPNEWEMAEEGPIGREPG